MELKYQLDPAYAHCYNEIENDPQLATLPELTKRIYASLRALDYQELDAKELSKRLMSFAFAISKVEGARQKQDAQFEKQQKIFVDAMKQVFYEFVPRERLGEAGARLRSIVGAMGDIANDERVETPELLGSGVCPRRYDS